MNSKRSVPQRNLTRVLLLAALSIGFGTIIYLELRTASKAVTDSAFVGAISERPVPILGYDDPRGAAKSYVPETSAALRPAGEGPLVISIKDRMQIGPAQEILNRLRPKTLPTSNKASIPTSPGEDSESEDGDARSFTEAAQRQRNLQLQDENGIIPADAYNNARRELAVMRSQDVDLAAGRTGAKPKIAGINSASWSWLGPGNIGGRIRSILQRISFDP